MYGSSRTRLPVPCQHLERYRNRRPWRFGRPWDYVDWEPLVAGVVRKPETPQNVMRESCLLRRLIKGGVFFVWASFALARSQASKQMQPLPMEHLIPDYWRPRVKRRISGMQTFSESWNDARRE